MLTFSTKRAIFHLFVFSIFYNVLLFTSPVYMLQIYNRIIPSRSEETLVWLTLLVIILFVFLSVIDTIRHMIFVQLADQFETSFSRACFKKALSFGAQEHISSRDRPLREIDQIKTLLAKGQLIHFFDILWFPAFVIALGLLHPFLACMAIVGGVWLGAFAFGSHLLTSRAAKKGRLCARDAYAMAEEMTVNAEVVKSIGMMPALLQRWGRVRLQTSADQCMVADQSAVITATGKTSRLVIQSLTLGLGAYLAISDAVSAGAIVASSILVGRALAPIEPAIAALYKLFEAKAAYLRLLRLMDMSSDDEQQLSLPAGKGCLTVDHLTCVQGNQIVLKDLSFELTARKMVAIVGPSGAGKSTLVKHLIGLRRGAEGFVRLDGIDLFTLSDEVRLQGIGYMPQEERMVTGTVVDCIGQFGSRSAEDILEATQLTDVHDMILKLPEGYATRIGGDGCYLSVGQQRRLALARAVCGMPGLVVFDEPSAFLDEAGERSLLQTIDELRHNEVTICVVTHKTTLIRQADLLVVLNARGESRVGHPEDIFTPRLRSISPQKRLIKNEN